ncbi:DUF554 domain-containing protein [Actinoplanes sp. NPDC051343]|uniref:DUF554 domain-containing protein n=1 Tax=Actinoplanes sp. NPDC051343 TaxID=3363906 RepID=UPI00379892C3
MAVPGLGTLINAAAIVGGAGLGTMAGHRLPDRVRDTVTDVLGLITLVIGGLDVASLVDPSLTRAVGSRAPLLIMLGALVLGSAVGAAVHLQRRLELLGDWMQRRLSRDEEAGSFSEGFVTASLVVAVGPLAILGALSDGLGRGIDQLVIKSVMDGVICIAFGASLGWGVAAAALSVIAVQGSFTAVGATLGTFLPDAEIATISAVGGVLLLGVGLRILNVRPVPVANMLPALIAGPLLTWIVAITR